METAARTETEASEDELGHCCCGRHETRASGRLLITASGVLTRGTGGETDWELSIITENCDDLKTVVLRSFSATGFEWGGSVFFLNWPDR